MVMACKGINGASQQATLKLCFELLGLLKTSQKYEFEEYSSIVSFTFRVPFNMKKSAFLLVQSLLIFFHPAILSKKIVLLLGCDHSACQCTSGPEVISRWCVGICTSFIYLKLRPGKRFS